MCQGKLQVDKYDDVSLDDVDKAARALLAWNDAEARYRNRKDKR